MLFLHRRLGLKCWFLKDGPTWKQGLSLLIPNSSFGLLLSMKKNSVFGHSSLDLMLFDVCFSFVLSSSDMHLIPCVLIHCYIFQVQVNQSKKYWPEIMVVYRVSAKLFLVFHFLSLEFFCEY